MNRPTVIITRNDDDTVTVIATGVESANDAVDLAVDGIEKLAGVNRSADA